MARKSRNQVEGRSLNTRGRRLNELEDNDTEEELKRFLKEGADFDATGTDEMDDQESDAGYRPYRKEPEEAFGSLGQFWLADN